MLLPLVAVVPMLVYPPDKRGTAMGMAGIVMAAGPAIGPVVGGLVIDGFGWRPMFIGIAVVALVILVGGTMMLKNVSELKNPKLNVLSVILSTIAFGGLLYGFSSASTMGWASPVVITSIVVGLVPSSHSYTSKSSSMSHCCALTPLPPATSATPRFWSL